MNLSAAPARRILLVGDETTVRSALRGAFDPHGIATEEAGTCPEALRLMRATPPDVIVADLAIPAPGGIHLLSAAREIDPTVGFILLVEGSMIAEAVDALRAGADDYILKPFDLDEVVHAVLRTLHHRQAVIECHAHRVEPASSGIPFDDRDRILLEALLAMAAAVEARDGYNGRHLVRVTKHSVSVGRRMGLPPARLRDLWIGSLLHDVGKIGIPEEILRKPTRLTPEEDEVMWRHPVIGAAIVERSELLKSAAPVIRYPHERWDGGGYPDGLAGEEIPLEGRILAVTEAYDALVTMRPYRRKRSRAEAILELRRCAGTQFDARIVELFVESLGTEVTDDLQSVADSIATVPS